MASRLPLRIILAFFLVFVVSALILLTVGWLAYRLVVPKDPDPRPRALRYLHTGLATGLSCLAFLFVDASLSEVSINHYVNEVAKNGLYNFGYCMVHYDRN